MNHTGSAEVTQRPLANVEAFAGEAMLAQSAGYTLRPAEQVQEEGSVPVISLLPYTAAPANLRRSMLISLSSARWHTRRWLAVRLAYTSWIKARFS